MYYENYAARRDTDCPVCGEREISKLYFDLWDDCVGCDCCVTEKIADEYLDELEDGATEREIDRRLIERLEDGLQ